MTPPLSGADEGALARLVDALLPGDGTRWPAFSAAAPPATLPALLDAAMMEQLLALSSLGGTPAERLAAFERDEPAALDAILRALYAVYYSSPAVQRAVWSLAEGSPREPSPYLEAVLVAGVLDRAASRREDGRDDTRTPRRSDRAGTGRGSRGQGGG